MISFPDWPRERILTILRRGWSPVPNTGPVVLRQAVSVGGIETTAAAEGFVC
jgi:hypothetical protein